MKKIFLTIGLIISICSYSQVRDLSCSGSGANMDTLVDRVNDGFDFVTGRLDSIELDETVSRTIYIATTGSDVTGDGSVGLPFATVLRALQDVKNVLNPNSSIAISPADGNYVFSFQELFPELNRIKASFNSAIYVYGSANAFGSPFTLAAGSPDAYNYTITGTTFTANELIGKYLGFIDGTFAPIAANTTNTLQTTIGAAASTQAYSLGVTFTCSDLSFRGASLSFADSYDPTIGGANITFDKINFVRPSGKVYFVLKNNTDFYNCAFTGGSFTFDDGGGICRFASCSFIASSTSSPVVSINCNNIFLNYCTLIKSGTRGSTGLAYNNNTVFNYSLFPARVFDVYISNTTTGILINNGKYIIAGSGLIADATTAISITGNTDLYINNIYVKNCTNLLNGTDVTKNLNITIDNIYGTPTNLYAGTIFAGGFINPQRNVYISVPGIPKNFSRKTLTKGSAVDICDISLANNSYTGGTISYTIISTDGTDYTSHSGTVNFTAVSKVATITSNVIEDAALESNSLSTGTFTDTWSVTNGTGKITLNVNSNPSITPTTHYIVYDIKLQSATESITPL